VSGYGGWERGGSLAARALVVAVLGCSLVSRVIDANPHPSLAYVPFVVALYGLPLWYATGRGRQVWDRHAATLLSGQAVLTYVPFALFGTHWVGGASGLLGALVLLVLPTRAGWSAFAGLTALELVLWLLVGLPFDPGPRAAFWVVNAFVITGLSGFALNRLADLLDALAATRHTLVIEAVTRQRLAAGAHLQERIVTRLKDLSEYADAVVRANERAELRAGLVATGRLARMAAADARRLILDLPDPSVVDVTAGTDASAIAPRLARGVAGAVVGLFATQFLLNVALRGDGATRGATAVAAVGVSVAVVALTVRHLGLDGSPTRPEGWPWTLTLLTLLSLAFYPSAGAAGLGLLALVAASGMVLVRSWARWLFLAAVLIGAPALTLARPSADLTTRHEQALWSVYAATNLATATLLVFGLSWLTRVSLAVQTAQQEVAGAAATAEQLRLAHDAHDALGLGLSTIALKSDLALGLLDTDPQRARHETVQIMHLAALVARDAQAVESERLGLDLAVELAGARSTLDAAGIAAQIGVVPDGLPHARGEVLAAVLREAVTNVLRHSHAKTCQISFDEDTTGLVLQVTNDRALASRNSSPGMGLDSMGERLRAIGGTVRTQRNGDIHTLTVILPAHRGVAVPG
jgi:two-component system sensor histidine kinase DesK